LQVSMSGIGNCFKDGDTGLPIAQFLSDLRWGSSVHHSDMKCSKSKKDQNIQTLQPDAQMLQSKRHHD
jgi:hypothetical protein